MVSESPIPVAPQVSKSYHLWRVLRTYHWRQVVGCHRPKRRMALRLRVQRCQWEWNQGLIFHDPIFDCCWLYQLYLIHIWFIAAIAESSPISTWISSAAKGGRGGGPPGRTVQRRERRGRPGGLRRRKRRRSTTDVGLDAQNGGTAWSSLCVSVSIFPFYMNRVYSFTCTCICCICCICM